MEAVVAQKPDDGTGMGFVTEADWIPNFWNYLLNLDRYDLVAELVQNDLDQDATRTVISFKRIGWYVKATASRSSPTAGGAFARYRAPVTVFLPNAERLVSRTTA